MRRAVSGIALLALAACAQRAAPAVELPDESAWPAPDPQSGFATREVHRTAWASRHLTVVTQPLRAHRHVWHAETVQVVEGAGTLTIDGRAYRVHAGLRFVIPAGARHSYAPSGDGPTRVISTFRPPFDGRDRLFDEP